MLLIIYAGAPIFLIMPMLIYGPKILLRFLQSPPESNPRQLLWHQRLLKQLLGRLGVLPTRTATGNRDQHRRLQTISFYWEDRFVFAVQTPAAANDFFLLGRPICVCCAAMAIVYRVHRRKYGYPSRTVANLVLGNHTAVHVGRRPGLHLLL